MKKTIPALLVLVCVLACGLVPDAQINGMLSVTGQAASPASDGRINDLPEIKRPSDYPKNKAYIEANPISPELSKALDDFSMSTAKVFVNGKTNNSMYSPLSLYIPLSLAATGTKDQTYSEMAALMGMGQDVAKFSEDMGKLYRRSYINTKTSTLKLANSLWFQDGMKFKKAFGTNATNNYYTTIHKVDFTKASAGKQMSGWVAEHTNNLLKPALKPNADTKLAIMNTIYYKDNWTSEFNKSLTKPQTFYLNDGSTVTCDFMSNSYYGGPYLETSQFSATSMRLMAGGKMYVVLPKKGIGVDTVLSNKAAMQSITGGKYENSIVNLKMPKFSFSTSYKDIIEKLKTLGVNQAFTLDADFSKTSSTPLHISNIRQDTKISVHEAGLEAAAFTIVEMDDEDAPYYEDIKTVDLVLDRPFLFIITSDFGAPLFIGVCNNPLAEK